VWHRTISSGGEYALLLALEKKEERRIIREAGFREE